MVKKIEGYNNYFIDDLGNVYSNKVSQRNIKGKVIKLALVNDNREYKMVNLFNNGVKKTWRVHRLVALSFIANPESKKEINHKNGIKTDNRVENLEWCSGKENLRHAIKNGLRNYSYGENAGKSKLLEIQVIDILNSKENNKFLANYYCVSENAISMIRLRKTWKHISI